MTRLDPISLPALSQQTNRATTTACLNEPSSSSQGDHKLKSQTLLREPNSIQANSGVGYATAQILADHPDHHVILACRDLQKDQRALSELQSKSLRGTLSLLQLGVEDDTSITQAVHTVDEQYNRLDVLIGNARLRAPTSTGCTRLNQIFSTNVIGATLVSEAFIPILLKSEKPYLIQVSSALGQ